MTKKLIIGTRGSQLALWQADYVEAMLKEIHTDWRFERVILKTEGDRDQKSSLTRIGGQGVFTKTIEDALLAGRVDIAVHSLKDLPSEMAPGLMLGAVPKRGAVEDVLVTKEGSAFADLKQGATVATGSIRRRSQLLNMRPDLRMTDLRGNIETRLRKLYEQNLDAIVMARAALERLGLNHVRYHSFTVDQVIPAVGQGAVGVQIRENDEQILGLLAPLNDADTFRAVKAERAFLRELDSGCQFPVGAYAEITEDKLRLNAFVGSEDGKTVLRDRMEGSPEKAEEIGRALALRFIERGALKLLNPQA